MPDVMQANTLRGFLREHVALVTSSLVAITVVLKIARVAHGDPTTMAAIASSSGAVNLAISTVVTAVQSLFWVLWVWAVPRFGESVRERDPLFVPAVALAVVFVIVALTSPWKYFVAGVAYLAWWLISNLPFQ